MTGISSTYYGHIQNFRLRTLGVPVSNSYSWEALHNSLTSWSSKSELRFLSSLWCLCMAIMTLALGVPMQLREFWEHSRNSLNSYQANVFDSKHLAGASSDLVRSMVKVGRKAAELEQVKLQTEIIKEQSELSTSEPLEGSVYICK